VGRPWVRVGKPVSVFNFQFSTAVLPPTVHMSLSLLPWTMGRHNACQNNGCWSLFVPPIWYPKIRLCRIPAATRKFLLKFFQKWTFIVYMQVLYKKLNHSCSWWRRSHLYWHAIRTLEFNIWKKNWPKPAYVFRETPCKKLRWTVTCAHLNPAYKNEPRKHSN